MTKLTTPLENDPSLQFRIDAFEVPEDARAEFEAAMRANLEVLAGLPGFRGHLVFRQTGGPSRFGLITLAVWESRAALDAAATAVRAHSERIGFDRTAALARWRVRSELGGYEVLRPPA
ncbi:Antibiotic biosynthesis monooxygenase [Anaeromyxobacter dehalogenans 2CP-1]|uniref:Antibiotic biosynthesis monooxygenase n=1 Tax=Anaeromyxobacter dehalogenans (strain ATCC BAA-258 / DSM 21875 / 2CP-1) TaxID=455488 RepID=B8JC09_ANAD2|nr:antibiotic biosynthesis monooxygenase family protein [Anaeromyxobacter dehalogenans]ACL63931.1 Antibiotic biosynthesis monooxygenase [Anaeromyxobacter dehalogenans 2CP-1]